MEMNTFLEGPPDPAPSERRDKPPHVFEERDFADHRQVYVGIHMPMKSLPPVQHPRKQSASNRLRTTRQQLIAKIQKRRRLESKGKPTDDSNTEEEGAVLPAAERVKFILGAVDETMECDKHELFTELEEFFVYDDGSEEWKEIARWFKYEEDVEEGGDRWSKPHVATVSLCSVIELRSSLISGTVILDLDAASLEQIADLVLDHLVSCNKLEELNRLRVRDTLLRRHRHQRPPGLRRGLSNIISNSRKSFSTLPPHANGSLQSRRVSAPHLSGPPGSRVSLGPLENGAVAQQGGEVPASQDQRLPRQLSLPPTTGQPSLARNDSVQGHLVYQRQDTNDQEDYSDKVQGFMKKLPANAEASNVLVGEVDFLEKPITVFIRLQTPCILGDLTEVPIPTRFLFVMMGPSCNPGRYREVGRAISTLMADEIFHDVAYKAKSRDDLIAGIDEFLEQVTILPPGEWDPSIRIEPPLQTPTKESRRPVKDSKKHGEKNGVGSGNNSGSENGDCGDEVNVKYWTRHKKVFGGLELDLANWRQRCRDLRDALHLQCLGSVFFMYCTYLALFMSLGQSLKEASGNHLTEREQLLSVVIVGSLFSVLGGQPLALVGITLPSLIYEKLLYKVCALTSLDYLPFRMWIGLWTALLLLLLVAFDVSILVRFFTRFALETFLVLVSLTLIYEGFHNLYKLQEKYPVLSGYFQNESCQCLRDIKVNTSTLPAVLGSAGNLTRAQLAMSTEALSVNFRDCSSSGGYLSGTGCGDNVYFLSILLTLSTLAIVLFLASFRITGFFPKQFRYILGDFATLITVCIMSALALCYDVNIPFVSFPTTYHLAASQRTSWVVPAFGNSAPWIVVLAFLPAIPLTLVLFLEQQLTGLFANKRENKLQKPFGYHLDLTIVAIGVSVEAVLGLPFLAGSIFVTCNHVQSLHMDSAEHARLRFKGVREQRVTALITVVLVGVTPVLMPVLKYIPVPVLYGILIYAAVRMLHNVQFVERLKLMLMPPETQPDLIYLRQVPTLSVHIFTVIQLVCLTVLWLVRASNGAIIFPLVVLLMVFVRTMIERMFSERDLMFLDDRLPRALWHRRKKNGITEALMEGEGVDGEEAAGNTNQSCVDEEDGVVLDMRNGSYHPFCLADELRKTAVWQQVIKEENSSSANRDSPIADTNSSQRKRRRKCRSRHVKQEKQISMDGSSSRDRIHDRKQKKSSSGEKEKLKTSKREDVAPLPPWEDPYQSPPRTDMRLLDIPEFDVHVDPACSRSGSKSPSSCELSEHSSA